MTEHVKSVPFSPEGEFTRTVRPAGYAPFDITFRLPTNRVVERVLEGMTPRQRDLLEAVDAKVSAGHAADGVAEGLDLTDDEAMAYDELALQACQACLTGWTLAEPCTPDALERIEAPAIIVRMYLEMWKASIEAKN